MTVHLGAPLLCCISAGHAPFVTPKEKFTGSTDMVGMSDLASVESVTQVLSDLTCSNHTFSQLVRKHSTKHVPSANVKCKLPKK
jgi:hypothetical protein